MDKKSLTNILIIATSIIIVVLVMYKENIFLKVSGFQSSESFSMSEVEAGGMIENIAVQNIDAKDYVCTVVEQKSDGSYIKLEPKEIEIVDSETANISAPHSISVIGLNNEEIYIVGKIPDNYSDEVNMWDEYKCGDLEFGPEKTFDPTVEDSTVPPQQTTVNPYQALIDSAITFSPVETKVERSNGFKVCNTLSNSNCIFISEPNTYSETLDPYISLFEKPKEGQLYKFEITGEGMIPVEYKNGTWTLPEYFKGAEKYVMKRLEGGKYPTYVNSDGDACYYGKGYYVDPQLENFPYWLIIGFSYEDGCDDQPNSIRNDFPERDEDFIKNMTITKV